jgi:hypothetical protein
MRTGSNGESGLLFSFSLSAKTYTNVMRYNSHVQSESHVRQVLLIGEDPKKYIEDYSKQFISNFLTLLRSTHGEKKTHMNQFYQQVIADKEVSFPSVLSGAR